MQEDVIRRDEPANDRLWDTSVIPGKVAEWPLAPVADFQALVRAKSPTEQIMVTVRQR
jgi:hypothetical protein